MPRYSRGQSAVALPGSDGDFEGHFSREWCGTSSFSLSPRLLQQSYFKNHPVLNFRSRPPWPERLAPMPPAPLILPAANPYAPGSEPLSSGGSTPMLQALITYCGAGERRQHGWITTAIRRLFPTGGGAEQALVCLRSMFQRKTMSKTTKPGVSGRHPYVPGGWPLYYGLQAPKLRAINPYAPGASPPSSG